MNVRTITVVLTVCLAISSTVVQGEEYTFNQTSGVWDTPDNWTPDFGPPGAEDTAIIPVGTTCSVSSADQEAKRISVETGGELKVSAGKTLVVHGGAPSSSAITGTLRVFGTLEVHEDFEVDGTLFLSGGTLEIAANLVVVGTGVIDCGNGAVIKSVSGKTLTIENGAAGDLFLIGGNVDIEVEFVNNAAVIVAGTSNTMTLKTNPKRGDGSWRAINNATLKVDVSVHGNSNWFLSFGNDTTLQINAECPDLGGDVEIVDGTLDANETFCTTGSLVFTNAVIDVAPGKEVRFSGLSCAS